MNGAQSPGATGEANEVATGTTERESKTAASSCSSGPSFCYSTNESFSDLFISLTRHQQPNCLFQAALVGTVLT